MRNASTDPEPDDWVVISLRLDRDVRDALRSIGLANQRTLSQEARFAIARRIREVEDEERAA